MLFYAFHTIVHALSVVSISSQNYISFSLFEKSRDHASHNIFSGDWFFNVCQGFIIHFKQQEIFFCSGGRSHMEFGFKCVGCMVGRDSNFCPAKVSQLVLILLCLHCDIVCYWAILLFIPNGSEFISQVLVVRFCN